MSSIYISRISSSYIQSMSFVVLLYLFRLPVLTAFTVFIFIILVRFDYDFRWLRTKRIPHAVVQVFTGQLMLDLVHLVPRPGIFRYVVCLIVQFLRTERFPLGEHLDQIIIIDIELRSFLNCLNILRWGNCNYANEIMFDLRFFNESNVLPL